MNILSWLISRIALFFTGRADERQRPSMISEEEAVSYKGQRNFNDDYRAATNLLKMRLSNRFPDNFHARVGSEANSTRDYGDERAGAIDTASATIAAALRKGATVRQAAEAGAASVGV